MKRVFLMQLDGVSGPMLDYGLRNNLMPYTRSLIRKGWNKRDFFCGLPSTTPASQFRLFYGIRDIVPGFRFFDKRNKTIIAFENPESVETLEKAGIAGTDRILMKDGMTICSIFTGNAKESISTGMLRKKKPILQFLLVYLSNPIRAFLFFMKLFVFLLIERSEFNTQKQPYKIGKLERTHHIAKRMIEETVVGEFSLFYSLRAMSQGVPIIYADFTGFDEIAHSYGPENINSRHYLSMLDEYIKQCVRAAGKSKYIYEVLIFSDHGQVASIPYKEFAGTPIQYATSALYKEVIVVGSEDMRKDADICILGSGGWGLIYDMKSNTQLSRSEMDAKYPDFFNRVSSMKGIECVLGTHDGKPILVQAGKTYDLTQPTIHTIFPGNLKKDEENIVFQMTTLLQSPNAPDAFLIGKILENCSVIFENQYGAHGSIGGDQTSSFFLSERFVFPEHTRDFADIHDAVWEYVHDNPGTSK